MLLSYHFLGYALSSVEFVDKHKIFGKLYSLHKINSVDCALFSVVRVKFLYLWVCCESSRTCIFITVTTIGLKGCILLQLHNASTDESV